MPQHCVTDYVPLTEQVVTITSDHLQLLSLAARTQQQRMQQAIPKRGSWHAHLGLPCPAYLLRRSVLAIPQT